MYSVPTRTYQGYCTITVFQKIISAILFSKKPIYKKWELVLQKLDTTASLQAELP